MSEYLIVQASSKVPSHTLAVIVEKLWGLAITYRHCICNYKQTTIREVRLLLQAKEKHHKSELVVILDINVYLHIGVL